MIKMFIIGLHRIFLILQNLLEIDDITEDGIKERNITISSLMHAAALP
jgi:hypothetical protein